MRQSVGRGVWVVEGLVCERPDLPRGKSGFQAEGQLVWGRLFTCSALQFFIWKRDFSDELALLSAACQALCHILTHTDSSVLT